MNETRTYQEYLTTNTWPSGDCKPISRGNGIYFWDTEENRYMDFSSQTLNLLFGQCHPEIVTAMTNQIQTLTYASSRFGSDKFFKVADKLSQMAPDLLSKVNIKMCDGSDANETAIKIARKYTKKTRIISFNQAHTGQTTQTIQLRGYARDPLLLAGNTEDIVFVDPPKCEEEGDYIDSIIQIRNTIENSDNIAAIYVDPVMVNSGVLISDNTSKYLKMIEEIAKENNILMILDENQTFGWVEGIFAANYYDISPDIITLGKGLSAGHPLAGVLVKDFLGNVLDYNEADFTNGGHVLSCAAAEACLSLLHENDYMIPLKEDLLRRRLEQMTKFGHGSMKTRGVGLIHALELPNDKISGIVFKESLERGLFLRRYKNYLVIKPPIIVTLNQIDEAMDILQNIIEGIS